MKKAVLYVMAVLLGGCAAAGSGGIQGVFGRLAGYESTITAKARALSIPQFGAYFVEFGADSSFTVNVREGERTYAVHMITFRNAKGAMGAYEFSRERGAEPINLGDLACRTASGIQFVKGAHLVTVRPGNGADAENTLAFAQILAKRIPGSPLPILYTPLPKDNLVKGSAFYFMGPKAFASRFSPELAQTLSIGEAIEGVAGKYTLLNGAEVTLVKVRFNGRTRTVQAVYDYIQTREGTPMVRPTPEKDYYTVFNADKTEMYVAEYADWLLFIPDAPRGANAQQLFEFALRSI